jgi:hypothetical protein
VDTGVYVVALTADRDEVVGLPDCPLSGAALRRLLAVRPELTVDGKRPTAAALGRRLAAFWCADEVVLYIGRAGPRELTSISALSDRITEYYATPLGARSPHAGGWPIKTLSNVGELSVHFGYCVDDIAAETRMLDAFAAGLSKTTRSVVHDAAIVMPFANLQDGHGRRKRHGIKGARAPLTRRAGARARASRAAVPPASPTVPLGTASVTPSELARELGVDPKSLRAWMRARASAGDPLFSRHGHGARWRFSLAEARGVVDRYRRTGS